MPKQFLDLTGLGTYHENITDYIDSKSVELTQDEYDDLVDEGGVDPDVTYYISDGVVPGSPVTDVKMNNVSIVSNHVANIPLVSSSTNGLVPQGTSVTTQSQSTKFLREDGSWQAPSYTSVSDRALIDGSNIGSPATFRQNIGVDYVDISGQIGVFNNRVTVSVLKAYKYSNGKIEIYVKGNIATNLSSGQTTIMTLPLTLTYGFDTFSGTASLNSNVITVSTAGTNTTGYIDLNHSGANSGDRFSFFISWFI